MSDTVQERLARELRSCANAFSAGDQTAPRVLLWPDPTRNWEPVIAQLQETLPELFVLGSYAPATRTGPALWLRCIEARLADGAPTSDAIPLFYLPGVSRAQLRAAEDCPKQLAPLVELQYRGTVWVHGDGKEWSPSTFLASKHGGLGLDLARDQSTEGALAGALPGVLKESVAHLQKGRLDAEFFNALVAPDATGLLLRWLSETEAFAKARSFAEFKAFCEQCKADLHFDPVKDGPLRAANLLATRAGAWAKVWQRFVESPANYSGIVTWLERAAPRKIGMFDSAEVWPTINQSEEGKLQQGLAALVDRSQDQVLTGIRDLEREHGLRRKHPWQRLGLSPLASALQPLAELAERCEQSPGAADLESYGEYYAAEGWRADAAAVATMAACGSVEQQSGVLGALKAAYLPWLEKSARHLQQLVKANGSSVSKRRKTIEPAAGRIVMFVDGLRMDVAAQLQEKLSGAGLESERDWEWSTIPSVTASGKPATSPIADDFEGATAGDEFAVRLRSNGNALTHDRFIGALKLRGWQFLASDEVGEPTGFGWTEAGAIDKRGHNDGWKLARSIAQEVQDLTDRITFFLKGGWREVVVVTDHGWLLMPYGLPRVDLKAFLAEHKWGRCAALKVGSQTDVPTYHWHWNADVAIATPSGVGCFRASMEYSHGGISLQEMVTPVVRVSGATVAASARLLEAKWTGAKCRVAVGGDCEGVRVDVRTNPSDPASSLLTDGLSRETTAEGNVTVYLEDDALIGQDAEIVLLNAKGQLIHTLPTKLGS